MQMTNYSSFVPCDLSLWRWKSVLVWYCLVWMWSLGRSQHLFSCILGHFWYGDTHPTEQPSKPSASLLLTSEKAVFCNMKKTVRRKNPKSSQIEWERQVVGDWLSAMRDPSRIVSAKPISNWTQLPFDLETQSYSRSICSNNRTDLVDVFKNICPGPSGQHGQAPTARTGLRPPQTTSGLVRDKVIWRFLIIFFFQSDFQTHERKPSTKYLCSHFDRMLTVDSIAS